MSNVSNNILSFQSFIDDDKDNILLNCKLTLEKQSLSKINNFKHVYTFTSENEHMIKSQTVFNNQNLKNIDISKILKTPKTSIAEQMCKEYYEENSGVEYLDKNIFTGDNDIENGNGHQDFENIDVINTIILLILN